MNVLKRLVLQFALVLLAVASAGCGLAGGALVASSFFFESNFSDWSRNVMCFILGVVMLVGALNLFGWFLRIPKKGAL